MTNGAPVLLVAAGLALGGAALGRATADIGSRAPELSDVSARVHILECRHELYEDGSTRHADAETAAQCLDEFAPEWRERYRGGPARD